MRILYIIALIIVTPLNWLFMHISNWFMIANMHINMWLLNHTKINNNGNEIQS